MKNYLIGLLWLAILVSAKAQLTGTAYLQGQTNHSGILIKFIAQSGTAVTDSTFTTASGNYSITIAPGVYSVTFSKSGYIDVLYNNYASILLTNTSTLSAISMAAGSAVFVNGNVSGTWTGGNVYIVTGDLTVPANSILTIMAGAKVQFNGYYSISGSGTIKASGSSGNPILFTSGLQSKGRADWKQIGLNSTNSFFDNCIFECANFALNFQSGCADVKNCVFRHCGSLGAYMGAGTPLIENNEIYDLDYSQSAIGIWVEGSAIGNITCNYIHNINSGGYNSYGIIHNSSFVSDNRIDSVTGPSPRGIQTRYAGARNTNNYISNSGTAIDVDGSWTASNPLIANNTLYSNRVGIQINCGSNPTQPTIVNNLITDNMYGISQAGTTTGTFSIDHNILWHQTLASYSNVQIVGLGQMIATNSAGYPIDAYFNMFQDPLYNGAAPLLSGSSPCFGTSNTAYSQQIGFSNPQACAATVVSIPTWNDPGKLSIFPNPCPGRFTLSAASGNEVLVTIFDLNGRMVHTEATSPGQQITVAHLENGLYVLNVKNGELIRTTLLAISK